MGSTHRTRDQLLALLEEDRRAIEAAHEQRHRHHEQLRRAKRALREAKQALRAAQR